VPTPDPERLHERFVEGWNARDARAIADLFADDGAIVGFDGSTVEGRDAIHEHLAGIFAHHETAAYVAKPRFTRRPSEDVALLLAVVGMVPPGKDDINPAVNAVQTLVASPDGVTLLQTTPAAFHGRPEEGERLTEELRGLLGGSGRH
jgi:uncharacterized protein (TIGR02246 family)